MPLVTPQSSAHYYHKDGTPCHSVPMKTDPSKTRNTTIADARKLNLLPSVTTIIRILDKPNLTAWKEEQMVMAALTLPHIEGETIDERAKRAVSDAQTQVEDARKKGSLLHSAIEQYLLFGEIKPHETVAALFEPFVPWARENILSVEYAEQIVIGDGYAGTVDMKANLKGHGSSICDFKSRKPSQGKIRAYDEDGLQLAAYYEADAADSRRAESTISIFINSVEPAEPVVHVWDAEERTRYWAAFINCFNLWKLLKNYEPTSK